MTTSTRFYFGDGVYAEFDGTRITLTTQCGSTVTNRIYLDPILPQEILDWQANGYRDWNSGQRFGAPGKEPPR